MTIAADDTTVKAALADAAARLAAAGIAEPRREARLLVAAGLGWSAAEVFGRPDAGIDRAARSRLEEVLARRARREPISRILGHREFWSLRFALSPETLDPRPDSETLIEAALAELTDRTRPYRVLDFGTGTGCLLLALLSELPNAEGLGVDCLPGAAETARRNAAALGLRGRARVVVGDWGAAIQGKWDLIIANPPYIESTEVPRLMPEVADYEPRAALDGGADGLDAYRALAPEVVRLGSPGAIAVVEVGAGQATGVTAIMAEAGLVLRGVRYDLSGVDRCLVLGQR
jgi:release factor glutamine methyltransferase